MMKVLLYSEGKNIFGKSGVGQALNHQKEALGLNNVDYTLDPHDDYDIVHINTIGYQSWKVLKKAKQKGKPVIYHTHTTYEDFKGSVKFSNQLAPFIKIWAKKLYNSADYLISPTEYTKNLIESKYLINNREIRVISNGVSNEKFSKNKQYEKMFEEQYKVNKPIVVTAGLPFERKGIVDFVEVVKSMPDVQFYWFGASSIKPILPNKIKKIIDNPPENLIFPGFVDKEILIGAFSKAKAFLFMSYEENEGIVILEALSAELPIVLRDIPVYNNWMKNDWNCFKARNNKEFINKLKNIVQNKIENIQEIIDNGKKTALERDLFEVGKKYKEYYEYILGKQSK